MARYGSSGPVVGEAVKDGYGGEWPGEAWSYVAVMERRGVLRCDWGSSGGRCWVRCYPVRHVEFGYGGRGKEGCVELLIGVSRYAGPGSVCRVAVWRVADWRGEFWRS